MRVQTIGPWGRGIRKARDTPQTWVCYGNHGSGFHCPHCLPSLIHSFIPQIVTEHLLGPGTEGTE